jgi:hypothetical protein
VVEVDAQVSGLLLDVGVGRYPGHLVDPTEGVSLERPAVRPNHLADTSDGHHLIALP